MSMNTRPPLTLSRLRPDDLDGLDDEEWKQVVDADLRRKASNPPGLPRSISTALRSPRYVDRLYVTLSAIVVSLEGQLRMREDDYESDQAGCRSTIMRAEFDLEEARRKHLPDTVRKLTHELHKARVRSEDLKSQYLRKRASTMRFKSAVEEALTECELLRTQLVAKFHAAIETHRRTMKDEGIEPSSIDEDLWKVLDEPVH